MQKGYNTIETAQLLGISYRTVRKYLHEGIIKGQKIAGTRRWVIMEDEIRRLQGNEEQLQGVPEEAPRMSL